MSKYRKAIDVVSFALLSHGFYDTMNLPLPAHLAKGGNFQFFTNITLFTTLLFIVLKWTLGLNRVKSLYYTIWGLELSVSVTYWSLIFLFPHLLNTDSFDVSLVLDLEIHLLPYVYLCTLAKCVPRVSFKRALVCSLAFVYTYWTLIEWFVFANSGDGVTSYPYPFLKGISLLGRAMWFLRMVVISMVNYVSTSILF